MKRWIVERTYSKGNMRARFDLRRLGRAVPVEDHGPFVVSADHGGVQREAEGVARRRGVRAVHAATCALAPAWWRV